VDQLKKIWDSLSLFQRLSLGVVVIAAGGAIMWLSSWKHESNFKPLYRGLASEDAAEAMQKLKENNVEFRLEDDGATVLVPAEKLAETRLILAREGLPKTGRIGFELFDKTNFATTDFAEQVNYRRALEGELARTISTLAEIERARVHLTFAKDSVFVDSRQPAKASVLLNLRRAGSLSSVNVAAIAHLVASSVEGLSPQQVTIVDSHGELLNKPRGTGPLAAASDSQLDYQMTMEHELANKLNQTLDPVLGPGNYRTGVSVECDFSGVDESEEVLDPTKSVMLSSQRTDETVSGGARGSGIPGTASNLPSPPPQTASNAGTTRRTESASYQTSRLVRHIEHPRGGVKRITVAVLLDQSMRWERKGGALSRTFIPPTPEKIGVIKDMITNVAGINAARGDQVTVETLPFDGTLREDPPGAVSTDKNTGPPQPAWMDRLHDTKIVGGAAGFVLAAAAFLLWRAKRRRHGKRLVEITEQLPALPEMARLASAEQALAVSEREAVSEEQKLIDSLKGPMLSATSKTDALTKYLRQEVKKDPQAATQLLRTWLLEDEH
jgi:flagellar M-ring protein FliF